VQEGEVERVVVARSIGIYGRSVFNAYATISGSR